MRDEEGVSAVMGCAKEDRRDWGQGKPADRPDSDWNRDDPVSISAYPQMAEEHLQAG